MISTRIWWTGRSTGASSGSKLGFRGSVQNSGGSVEAASGSGGGCSGSVEDSNGLVVAYGWSEGSSNGSKRDSGGLVGRQYFLHVQKNCISGFVGLCSLQVCPSIFAGDVKCEVQPIGGGAHQCPCPFGEKTGTFCGINMTILPILG